MAIGDAPLVMNQTRGALWGGKCGDFGRGGFDGADNGALLVMSGSEGTVYSTCCSCWLARLHAAAMGCAVETEYLGMWGMDGATPLVVSLSVVENDCTSRNTIATLPRLGDIAHCTVKACGVLERYM